MGDSEVSMPGVGYMALEVNSERPVHVRVIFSGSSYRGMRTGDLSVFEKEPRFTRSLH